MHVRGKKHRKMARNHKRDVKRAAKRRKLSEKEYQEHRIKRVSYLAYYRDGKSGEKSSTPAPGKIVDTYNDANVMVDLDCKYSQVQFQFDDGRVEMIPTDWVKDFRYKKSYTEEAEKTKLKCRCGTCKLNFDLYSDLQEHYKTDKHKRKVKKKKLRKQEGRILDIKLKILKKKKTPKAPLVFKPAHHKKHFVKPPAPRIQSKRGAGICGTY